MASQKVLLAYDGSEEARRALEFAVDYVKLSGAAIGVVSVVPVHAGRIGNDPWDDASVHSAELREAMALLTAAGLTPILHEPFGEVAEQIVRTADEHDYDHIVVGSRHLGALDRVLQGSVSGDVAASTHATVTIVH